jgi:hypothetical protein
LRKNVTHNLEIQENLDFYDISLGANFNFEMHEINYILNKAEKAPSVFCYNMATRVQTKIFENQVPGSQNYECEKYGICCFKVLELQLKQMTKRKGLM